MSESKVEPLRKRTMTLEQLQERTVRVLRKIPAQLRRQGWEGGQTMGEFFAEVSDLMEDIKRDREMRWSIENRRLEEMGFARGSVNNSEPAPCVICGKSVTGRMAWWRTQGGQMGVFCRPCAGLTSLARPRGFNRESDERGDD